MYHCKKNDLTPTFPHISSQAFWLGMNIFRVLEVLQIIMNGQKLSEMIFGLQACMGAARWLDTYADCCVITRSTTTEWFAIWLGIYHFASWCCFWSGILWKIISRNFWYFLHLFGDTSLSTRFNEWCWLPGVYGINAVGSSTFPIIIYIDAKNYIYVIIVDTQI